MSALVADEIAVEQAHVDLVYAELVKAGTRAGLVEADGLARGRTDRVGTARDEELTGLFERDALVFHAARRRNALESQYEGLVFGRLDIDHPPKPDARATPSARSATSAGSASATTTTSRWSSTGARRPRRRSTGRPPSSRWASLRRRVLRCKGVRRRRHRGRPAWSPRRPTDLVVVGDGALMAALTRSRGDPDARHRRHHPAPAGRGDPGAAPAASPRSPAAPAPARPWSPCTARRTCSTATGAGTSPAASSSSARRRPTRRTSSGCCPSLGEETVTLRSLGDVVDGVSTERLDTPAAAAIKG